MQRGSESQDGFVQPSVPGPSQVPANGVAGFGTVTKGQKEPQLGAYVPLRARAGVCVCVCARGLQTNHSV